MKETWYYSDITPPTKAKAYTVRVSSYEGGHHFIANVNKADWRLYPFDPLGGRWFFNGKLSPYLYGLIEYLVEE